jgi:hypothetical protein
MASSYIQAQVQVSFNSLQALNLSLSTHNLGSLHVVSSLYNTGLDQQKVPPTLLLAAMKQ